VYSIARKLAFTKPFFIAKLLINQSFDFLHHMGQRILKNLRFFMVFFSIPLDAILQ